MKTRHARLKREVRFNGKTSEFFIEGENSPVVYVRPPVTSGFTETEQRMSSNDFAFIQQTMKENGKKLTIDGSDTESPEAIRFVFENPDTRLMFTRSNDGGYEYAGIVFICPESIVKSFGYKHCYELHGFLRTTEIKADGTKILRPDIYKKIAKYNILQEIIDLYFTENPDIITINAWLPEFLKRRLIKDKSEKSFPENPRFKWLPTYYLLRRAGFWMNPYPLRNLGIKNGKLCDVFYYQMHRTFWERNIKRA